MCKEPIVALKNLLSTLRVPLPLAHIRLNIASYPKQLGSRPPKVVNDETAVTHEETSRPFVDSTYLISIPKSFRAFLLQHHFSKEGEECIYVYLFIYTINGYKNNNYIFNHKQFGR